MLEVFFVVAVVAAVIALSLSVVSVTKTTQTAIGTQGPPGPPGQRGQTVVGATGETGSIGPLGPTGPGGVAAILAGDVVGPLLSNTVAFVNGFAASDVGASVSLTQNATPNATPNTLLLRDLGGNATIHNLTTTTISGSLIGSVASQPATTVAAATVAVTNATDTATPNTLVKRNGSGNASFVLINATTVDADLIGSVSGESASAVAAATMGVSNATDSASPNTLVRRDGSGNASFNQLTASSYFGDFQGTIEGIPASSIAAAATGIASATPNATPNTVVLRDGTASAAFATVNATSLNGNVIGSVGTQPASTVAAATVAVSNATNTNTPSTLMRRDASGNVAANVITATGFIGTFNGNLNGNAATATTATTATSFLGPLVGDVTGNQTTTQVITVGGQTASNIASGTVIALTATSSNTPSAVVRRDASGNISLSNLNLSGGIVAQGTITATGFIGNLTGNATTATSALTANSAASFTNPLLGDVTGSQTATIVSFVGGIAASLVATGTTMTLAATPNDSMNTIVKRDALGNTTLNQLTLVTDPVNPTDATNKQYVDQIATTGVVPKAPATVVAVSSITLSGFPTIDGVTVTGGDRVLATSQIGGINNGIWGVTGVAWARTADMPNGSTAATALLTILSGTTYGGSQWACSTPQATVGTDPIAFVLVNTSNQTSGNNVGVGEGKIYRDRTGNVLNFKTLQQGSFMTITNNTNEINIATNGTASNTPSTLVARDSNGFFVTSGITSSLTGAASSNVLHSGDYMTGDLNMFNLSALTLSVGVTGSAGISLKAPAALSSSYSLSLPATGPSSNNNQLLAATGAGSRWYTPGGTPSAGRTIYVNKSGSDTNDGSSAFPFLTVAKALTVANSLSSSANPVSIRVAAGVFVENISGGALQFTADGISIVGTSILSTIILPATPGSLFVSTTAAFELSELTLVGQGTGTAFTLTASATANGGFSSILIQTFGTAIDISSSAGVPIVQFDGVSSLSNTNVVSITNIRAIIRNSAFLGNTTTPAGNAITISGPATSSLLTLMSTTFRGFAQAVTVNGGAIARIGACPLELCSAGISILNGTCTMDGCSFVNMPTSGAGISVNVNGANSSVNMVGCLFNHRDVNGAAQGIGVSVSVGGKVAMSGCGINWAALALQDGTSNSDTNTTQMTCSSVCIRNCTADIQQNGQSQFSLVGGVFDETKITINDSTYVNLAAFDVSNSNAFSLGSGANTRNIIYQLLLGFGTMNPSLIYEPNYYGGQGSIYENLNAQVTVSGVQSASDTWKYTVTTDSSKIAALKMISDVGDVGVNDNVRGWTFAKAGTSAELISAYENSDSVGQGLRSYNVLSSYDGFNNVMNYPFATGGANLPTNSTTALKWGGDTNLYRASTGMLATDTQMTIGSFLTLPNLTPNRAVITDTGSSRLMSSIVTNTELSYVSGVTSSIQAQLNSKFGNTGGAFTNPLLGPNGSAANPTYSFSSDNTSGVYYSLTQGLLLSTSGIARLRLALTGEISLLGLGTGVVKSNASGQLSSSLITNADVDPAAAIVDTKLATINTPGKVDNSATTATASNTPSTIVARDASGNITISGLVTNSIQALNLQSIGVVKTDISGNFSTALVTNADISASAGIVDTKLATISTAGKVANSATSAVTGPAPNTIALRDNSGNSFFNSLGLVATSNQLVLGTTNTSTISATAPAASRVLTIPDPGGNASFLMSVGNQSASGIQSFTAGVASSSVSTGSVVITGGLGVSGTVTAGTLNVSNLTAATETLTATSNQLTLGTTNTTTINALPPASSRIVTIPDPGANANFLMSAGNQSASGVQSFTAGVASTSVTTGSVVITGGLGVSGNVTSATHAVTNTSNQLVLGSTNTMTINGSAPSASRVLTIPDPGANANFLMSVGNQSASGVQSFTAGVASTSSSTGSVVITGGLGVSGNVTAGSLNAGSLVASTETLTATSNQLVLGTTNTTTINSTAPAASRVLTIPDPGSNANFLMSAGNQSASGIQSFTAGVASTSTTTGSVVITGGLGVSASITAATEALTATTNQLVLGTTNTATINSTAPAASRILTIPDPGANANFLMSAGNQSASGIQSFTAGVASTSVTTGSVVITGGLGVSGRVSAANETITATTNQLVLGTTNTTTINSTAPATSRTLTIPDPGADANFLMSAGNQSASGVQSFTANVASNSTTTGSVVITGGLGVSGNITAGTVNAGSLVASTETLTATSNQLVLGTTNTTTINSTAPAASRVLTIPDPGGNANFLMSAGNQSASGVQSFTAGVASTSTTTGSVVITGGLGVSANITAATEALTATTNQLVLGTTNTATINSTAPAASRVLTIPDPGANANFLMSAGNQSASGVQSFTANVASSSTTTGSVVITGGLGVSGNVTSATHALTNTSNQLVLGTTNTMTINGTAPSASRVLTIPDPGANANFLMSAGNQSASGVQSFTAGVASTSTTTGSVVITGGLGVSGSLNIGGRTVTLSNPNIYTTSSETAFAASTTVTAAQLLGGIIVNTAGNITLTLPTATQIATALVALGITMFIGLTFDCIFMPTAGGNITIAAGTGITMRRTTTTIANTASGTLTLRFTVVTSGSEAATAYLS